MSRVLVGVAIALPWLALLPLRGAPAAFAACAVLIAAFHGAGLVVARLARIEHARPLLAIQWGVAALIALSGFAIAVHAGTLPVHAGLVFGCAAIHSGALAITFAQSSQRLDAALAGSRSWIAPVALLATLGTLTVLGAAGAGLLRPFDDEGHVAAQVHRVLETGALGDRFGYPREAQLGGQVAFGAVLAGASDLLADRFGEALAGVLALALAIARIRPRDASSALWAIVVVLAGSALALSPVDPLPVWLATGLVLALHAMICDGSPPALPLALTAGALIALRFELAPIAATAALAAWWPRRDLHRLRTLALGIAAATLPLLVARPGLGAIAHGLVSPGHGSTLVHLLVAAAIAVPAALILQLAFPGHRALRWIAVATAIALAGIAAQLTGSGSYALRFAWPIGIAFTLVLIAELSRTRWSGPTALIASLVALVLVIEGHDAPGRLRWSRRLSDGAADIVAIGSERTSGAAYDYGKLLDAVPATATVAVWVSRPEALDYAHHRIIDLHTPAIARLRGFDFAPHANRIELLLTYAAASYLLVESDDARVQRIQTDLAYRFLCSSPSAACADDLEAIAYHHRVVARRGNLTLIELRQ